MRHLMRQHSHLPHRARQILWAQIIKSFSLTAVLIFGAVHSAKQSNIHRNNELKTRWFALEFKAIDPFISSLDIDTRNNLKLKLSDKLFGQQHVQSDKNNIASDENIVQTIGKVVVDIIKAKPQ